MNEVSTPLDCERSAARITDEPRRHPILWGLALVFLFLSVPFYYPSDREPVILWGLPDWCWVTLLANLAFAATVSVLVLCCWKESPGSDSAD